MSALVSCHRQTEQDCLSTSFQTRQDAPSLEPDCLPAEGSNRFWLKASEKPPLTSLNL